jgi:phenylalanyl-tRNA synthetase beta chain
MRYRPVPVVPAIERDLALLLPDGVSAALVHGVLMNASPLVESVRVVDEFRGKGLPEGHRSVAFRLGFRAADRTLRDAEIDPVVHRLLEGLEREHDVSLRTT